MFFLVAVGAGGSASAVEKTACEKFAAGIQSVVNDRVNKALKHLVINIKREMNADNKLTVEGTAPNVTATTFVRSRASPPTLDVTLTFTRGTITINGKALIDLGIAKPSGRISGTITTPRVDPVSITGIPCDLRLCQDYVTRVVKRVVDEINGKFLARLPTSATVRVMNDLPVFGDIDATLTMTWPRLAQPSLNRAEKRIAMSLSAWGPASVAIESVPISAAVLAKVNELGFKIPCALPVEQGDNDFVPPPPPPPAPYPGPQPTPFECGDTASIRVGFGSDSFRIKEDQPAGNAAQIAILRRIAGAVRDGCVLKFEGHSDCVGSQEGNQFLSERRASAVRQTLGNLARGNVAIRMKAVGHGFSLPACRTDSAGIRMNARCDRSRDSDCLARNRRVLVSSSTIVGQPVTGRVEGYVRKGETGYHCPDPTGTSCREREACSSVTLHPEIRVDSRGRKFDNDRQGQIINWVKVNIPEVDGFRWIPFFDVLPGPRAACNP
jgi:outer membrane protein OmpA-like peptidoglycan-associated protein